MRFRQERDDILSFYHSDVFGRYPYAHAVSVVPNVVGVYENVLIPVGKHGEVLMVSFVEDAGCAPHIGYGIVGGGASRLAGLVQFPADVGGDVGRCV